MLIRIKSRKAYEHLKKHKILALPSIDTLNRYIHKMDSVYGVHKSIFELLNKKSSEMSLEQRKSKLFQKLLEIQLRIILLRRYID